MRQTSSQRAATPNQPFFRSLGKLCSWPGSSACCAHSCSFPGGDAQPKCLKVRGRMEDEPEVKAHCGVKRRVLSHPGVVLLESPPRQKKCFMQEFLYLLSAS